MVIIKKVENLAYLSDQSIDSLRSYFLNKNIAISIGVLSNFYLVFIYKKTQLSDRSALIFLLIDIIQLAILIYLTGGVVNPFIIFILIVSSPWSQV